ncbi:M50 family metallopeptidase [Desulfovibrio sp. JC022]|uniref:M50 family metallopeptidase n=1 Tax=Desulfovibrio sp. JC022 TaxID=2593642 RepID=UPI0013D8D607|nr:M50 family metallopeptidase [Desulfovibrio sp. JC022]NDV24540.1 hypothetical protein [Desulfovibrio sp. JC022]
MLDQIDPDAPLPLLRSDLEILIGPLSIDGAPTYTVHDPVKRRFAKVHWAEAMVLERLRTSSTLSSLQKKLERETTVRVSLPELNMLVIQAVNSGLTDSTAVLPVETLMQQVKARRTSLIKLLVKNYLYIRLPLFKPDLFLDKTLVMARIFVSTPALCIYMLSGLIGLIILSQKWELYLTTFSYFFNPLGLFWYVLSIVLLKTIHEFSHAYTAKSAGVRVPVMGIAFIVMWPVAFCDTTDAWKINDRKKRFRIGAAGVATEFVIAGLALFGWGISPPGVFNSICFVVSSVSFISTLAINLNPAMSFDGYYMLMDLWGIDNLRSRAFNCTRWLYRKHLFGVEQPNPEKRISARRMTGFVIYAAYSWIYRLLLYLGIAIFVYYKFTKTLGLTLFIIEIWWFVLGPILKEVKALFGMLSRIRITPAMIVASVLLAGTGLWVGLPLERSITLPAIVVSKNMQIVYVPFPGVVDHIHVKKGDILKANAQIISFSSVELETEFATLEAELEILELQKGDLQLNEEKKVMLPQKLEEIGKIMARLDGVRDRMNELKIVARSGGEVLWWDETLYPGRPVNEKRILGRVAAPEKKIVRAYVNENSLSEIPVNTIGTFQPISMTPEINVMVKRISPERSRDIEHSALTSMAEGMIPVAPDTSGRMKTVDAWYSIELSPNDSSKDLMLGESGIVRLKTKNKSLLIHWARMVYRTLLRESGF